MTLTLLPTPKQYPYKQAFEYCDYHERNNEFVKFPAYGGAPRIKILPGLIGKCWDNYALGALHAFRPSRIRVSVGGCVHADSCPWRVTVVVYPDWTIQDVWQEVEVGIPVDLQARKTIPGAHDKVKDLLRDI